VVAETDAADGIRKVFIGGTDAMKFWLVKLVVADMIQYLSNKQVNLGLFWGFFGFSLCMEIRPTTISGCNVS
jgi:hypothetical protein